MTLVKRFLLANLLWGAAIMTLVIPISLMTTTGLRDAGILRWLGHSLALGAFPAGLGVGADAFRGRPWRNIGLLTIAELVMTIVVIGILVYAAELDDMNLFGLLAANVDAPNSGWLTWNQMAWPVFMTVAEAISVPIYAGLGMMLGAWGEQVLPITFRRILWWAMGLKLIGFTYLIAENSYEMFVVKTNGPAAFSAFFMLLIPLGMYGGLLLPSYGLAKRAQVQ